MAADIQIIWDGNVTGLAERRLSLDAFGLALSELLSALRRIASDIEMQAREPGGKSGRGRLAKEASKVDVQIVTFSASSPVNIHAQVVAVEPVAMPLINDLAEVAADAFLRDVEREKDGLPAHYMARRFLRALPAGLTSQTYRLLSPGGAVAREVKIGEMALREPRTSAHLVELWGVVVGFGFEEGHSEIKFRAETGELVVVRALADEVEAALALRLQQVHVMAVASGVDTNRLRLLRVAREEPVVLDADRRADHVFSSWRGLLARLAQ